ncbi:3-ketoacyl-ACP reductase [Candidatus Acidianus copahuensis]|uniref:3-ketoacyl-ACP reductase n=1 Tax=Candidatus Acidianus copahuensis TaxID=1160895 RepID=A0A031LLN9_9CREN|nr:SDR family NAD(P)-dependent oxidoreductase [Candidatus Acidianus copahuensis]EZQ06573.1 3-ketoacyl-ACP reductase [Candidatus Acidianus copahuensis]
MRLKNKAILLIGVSEGLGYALAYFCLTEGANVIINSGNEEKLKKISETLSAYGKIDYILGRVRNQKDAEEIIEKAYYKLKRIDSVAILIGGYEEDTIDDPKALDQMIDNHIKYPIYVISASIKYMRQGSSIVLVSAMRGIDKSLPTQLSYGIGKAGTAKAVEVLASELLERGIRVVGIAPSWIDGEFKPARDWRSLRKLGDPKAPPEDFARIAMWLMTDEAEWINGVVIPIDGGARLK